MEIQHAVNSEMPRMLPACRTRDVRLFRRLVSVWVFSLTCLSGLLSGQDARYLLILKAYPHHEKKERKFCELTSRVDGFLDHHGPFREAYGADVITGGSVRYGVRSVLRVEVLNRSTSEETPKSLRDSVYVLVYDPIYKICARSFSIADGKINYRDYVTGTRYDFPVRHRRRIAIYEIQVVSQNILPELWIRLMSPK